MNKFTITTISMVAMGGLAFAQGAQKAPDPKAGATTTTAKAGAGGATAAPAKADAKAPAAAPPAMPKPPAEIAAHLKAMGTTAKCTGVGMGGADMKTEMKFTGTMKAKSDLDGWWIRHTMDGKMGEGKAAMKFKMESFSTYDAGSKKWRGVSVMNDGGMMVMTSDGMKEGKMSATADAWGMWGQSMFRETIDATDMKAGVKMAGEMSMDKGKTWNKVYEMTCKK